MDKPLLWDGVLSEGQDAASNRVSVAVENSAELLVWAVAGAGKTEVLFAGIENALSTGMRVCIATPRTDVVLELAPRLQKVFPEITVAVLYGGNEDRHEYAQLTIATTHQLLRFYKAFDVMIVDEVDAFPYSIDETLQYAVQQSRKPESSLIYLTATPNKQWQKECRTGKRNYVTIPARFHRQPLPVPQFVWSGNWEKQLKKRKLTTSIKKWIEPRLASGKQALIFAPKIAVMDKILNILRAMNPLIESVHAEDPDRKEKVLRFRNKEIPILLTTTILERGVTIPNIDVAVIGAEDRIFTESALVQIAGRAGRSAEYPTGDVTFFHYGKTEAMISARRQIVMMNKEGIKKGLIDV
ncbi:DEAD/DEAH box helicase [Mesobacillus sp. AQ2]|uniref:DEAD/DEAH box helicase n=1 Tax=Mesobacillus sp. AQ2 TaxID=3043332 RepID=UPI0032E457DD